MKLLQFGMIFATALSYGALSAVAQDSSPPSCLTQGAWDNICMQWSPGSDDTCGTYNGTRYAHSHFLPFSACSHDTFVIVRGMNACASTTVTPIPATVPEIREIFLHWMRRVRIICIKRLVGVCVILLVSDLLRDTMDFGVDLDW